VWRHCNSDSELRSTWTLAHVKYRKSFTNTSLDIVDTFRLFLLQFGRPLLRVRIEEHRFSEVASPWAVASATGRFLIPPGSSHCGCALPR
jgi:hypothetical protein